MNNEDNKNSKKGGVVGAGLGFAAGALGIAMSNPIGKWIVFQSQDKIGLELNKKILEITSNADLSFKVHEIYNLITNTIMAYPAILPIVGGILAAGVGSLNGKKINKATLKRKSLTPKRNNVHAIK